MAVFGITEVLPMIKKARWKVLSIWELSKRGNISEDGDPDVIFASNLH